MLRSSHDSQLCPHHERKFRNLREADHLVDDLFAPISRGFITASSLSQSMARLFAAVAAGRIGPKTAVALSHVADTLLESIDASRDEFSSAFKDSQWLRFARSSIGDLSEFSQPALASNSAPLSAAPKSSRGPGKKQPRVTEDSQEHGAESDGSESLPRHPIDFIKQLAREL
jgi:hypothetical protein